jgi:hypothetical protein
VRVTFGIYPRDEPCRIQDGSIFSHFLVGPGTSLDVLLRSGRNLQLTHNSHSLFSSFLPENSGDGREFHY